jgi:hypothetical protein
MITEQRIKINLLAVCQEINELNELRDDFTNQKEWARLYERLVIKKDLLEEILEIE